LAVAIRLKRLGRKKRPFYRVVVADNRNPRQGKAVDDLGYYDPLKEPAEIQIDEDKALMWLKEGAQPTETVRSILSRAGVLRRFHEQRHLGAPSAEKEDEIQTIEQSDLGFSESEELQEEEP
jgi:small subunit ribosomal protein S16